MKHILVAALITLAPAAALADQIQTMNDAELSQVAGQAGFSLSSLALPPAQAAQVINGLQQASTLLNRVSPLLGSKGKAVATVVTSAATIAPVANKVVNGGTPTVTEVLSVVTSGVQAGVAISKLTSGL